MIKKKDITALQHQLKKQEKEYQEDSEKSRRVVKMSKQCIYAAMRGDVKGAKQAKKKYG